MLTHGFLAVSRQKMTILMVQASERTHQFFVCWTIDKMQSCSQDQQRRDQDQDQDRKSGDQDQDQDHRSQDQDRDQDRKSGDQDQDRDHRSQDQDQDQDQNKYFYLRLENHQQRERWWCQPRRF